VVRLRYAAGSCAVATVLAGTVLSATVLVGTVLANPAAASAATWAGTAASPAPVPPATAPPVSPSPPSPPVAPPRAIPVVQLGASFSPAALRLGVGQQFEVTVSSDVQVTWTGLPDYCPAGLTTQVAGGLLALQCTPGGAYLFTAEQPGTAILAATVQPVCAPGTMCPQWITEASLKITITWPGWLPPAAA
jgi:hypothetical protein